MPRRRYFYDRVSPGQQANDIHLTVCWHPNPLRHLTRGIANLLAIIQFASCKLPFHSAEETVPPPVWNICVKRITDVILIFSHTIKRHEREHCVHKIAHALDGGSVQRGLGSGKTVTAHCWLGQMLQEQARGASKNDNESTVAGASHTAVLHQSVED